MTAGIEGGCRRVIEDEYTWLDWMAACDSWARIAPPTHITLKQLADGFGGGTGASATQPVAASTPESLAAQFGIPIDGDLPIYRKPAKGLVGG